MERQLSFVRTFSPLAGRPLTLVAGAALALCSAAASADEVNFVGFTNGCFAAAPCVPPTTPTTATQVITFQGLTYNNSIFDVMSAGGFAAIGNDSSFELVSDWRLGDTLYRTHVDGRAVTVQVERSGIGYRVSHGGVQLELRVLSRRAAELSAIMPPKRVADTSRHLLSPMPGLLVSIAVAPGQRVKAGQELAVVEAMKMENMLRAERDARVGRLLATPGDSLSVDQAILEFELE